MEEQPIRINIDNNSDMMEIWQGYEQIFIGNFWDFDIDKMIKLLKRVKECEVNNNWEYIE